MNRISMIIKYIFIQKSKNSLPLEEKSLFFKRARFFESTAYFFTFIVGMSLGIGFIALISPIFQSLPYNQEKFFEAITYFSLFFGMSTTFMISTAILGVIYMYYRIGKKYRMAIAINQIIAVKKNDVHVTDSNYKKIRELYRYLDRMLSYSQRHCAPELQKKFDKSRDFMSNSLKKITLLPEYFDFYCTILPRYKKIPKILESDKSTEFLDEISFMIQLAKKDRDVNELLTKPSIYSRTGLNNIIRYISILSTEEGVDKLKNLFQSIYFILAILILFGFMIWFIFDYTNVDFNSMLGTFFVYR